MVIVESVALAIMVSNDIVMPLVLQRREALITGREDVGRFLLTVRRMAIFVILFFAYLYYRLAGDAQLASIGLLSFAAIAQLAPAFFGGLIWRRATARGALAGMTTGILVWAYTLLLPSIVDAGIVGHSILSQGPWGVTMLRPQALFGLDLPPLVHGVLWSLTLNVLAYVAFSFGRAPASIERLQSDLFVPSDLTPIAPTFRLWRSSVTVEELTTTIARYLGEERTRTSFDSYALTRGVSLDPKSDADFQVLRFAEHLLASAIGAASSRLVLSLLLRKRTVSTKAALRLLDDASAAIHYNREILQTALDHVRQGIAVFDKDLHLVCWNRQFGEILTLPPQLTRVGTDAARNPAARAPRIPTSRPPDLLMRERLARYVIQQRTVPRALRRARPGDRGALESDAGRRHRHDLHRHHAEREGRRRARTRQRIARTPGAGTHRGTDPAQQRTRPRQGRGRRGQHLQDQVSRRRQPRHPAAAQRRAALRHQPGRAPARRRRCAVDRQHRRLARRGRGDLRRAARHLASRYRRDEDREDEFPHRRAVPPARGRIHAAGAGEGPQAHVRRLLAGGAFRPAAAAAAAAEPRVQRHQVHARAAASWSAAGGAAASCASTSTIPASASRTARRTRSSRSFTASTTAPRWRAASALGSRSSSASRACSSTRSRVASTVGRGSCFAVDVPIAPALPSSRQTRVVRDADRVQLSGIVVLCIDNDLAILDGMETLLGGWGCRVLKAPDLASAAAAIDDAKVSPDGLLVDYHLDQGNGIEAIVELRQRFGTRPDRHPDHRRPQPASARGSPRARRSGAQQAGAAGRAARAADAMAGAARRRGGVSRRPDGSSAAFVFDRRRPHSSWPGLSRPSTSSVAAAKTWMPGPEASRDAATDAPSVCGPTRHRRLHQRRQAVGQSA